ncbi:MAG TPA: hypothetical protein VFQ30_19875 [Ktedonobacteraceae bacterium]|nr:hypothetical protein [Ktedonobacteraceae bacterium]
MSQQEMGYSEMNSERAESMYGRYEGHSSPIYGEKLSISPGGSPATAGQRLALAIASLVMLMILIFGLIFVAAAMQAPNWAVIPILFILVLFSSIVVIINMVFNRRT